MNKCAHQYRKTLIKSLRCSPQTKKELLDSFDRSLEAYFEEYPEATAEELEAAFGPPGSMAWVLMEGISDEEIAKHQAQQLLKRIAAGLLVVLLLALAVYGNLR